MNSNFVNIDLDNYNELIMNKFNEINNMVEKYWRTYEHKPNVIIISEDFSYGLRYMMTECEFFYQIGLVIK